MVTSPQWRDFLKPLLESKANARKHVVSASTQDEAWYNNKRLTEAEQAEALICTIERLSKEFLEIAN